MNYSGFRIIAILLFVLCGLSGLAQTGNIGIGTTSPNPKAMLDIQSSDKGLLIPRLTKAERDRIAQNGTTARDIDGLLIFNTDEGKFNYWASDTWVTIGNAEGVPGKQGEKGEKGDPGADGNSILSGRTEPAHDLGGVGDFYLNLSNFVFYGPKSVNGWPAGVSLVSQSAGRGEVDWKDVSGKPTTIQGFGITDALSANAPVAAGSYPKITYDEKGLVLKGEALTAADVPELSWNKIVSDKPTTLQGYGITDALNANAPVAAGTYPKITYDEKGLVVKGEALTAADVPELSWNKIVSDKPTTLQGYGITDALNANAPVAAGTYPKITYDEKGLVTKGEALAAADIPDLDWSKIVTGKPTTLAGYGITDGAPINFEVDRPITRQGLSATGQNLGQGKSVAEFLEAFFFPSLAATPPTVSFTTPVQTFPFSVWRKWTDYKTSIDFQWSVINNSKTDPTDDKEIVSVVLKSGSTQLGSVADPASTTSGSFSDIEFKKSNDDPTTDYKKTFTLEVRDEQPNTVTKDLTLELSKAVRLAVANPTLTPSATVYEYSPDDIELDLNWSITPNDEQITSIKVAGVSTGSEAATGKSKVIFKSPENGGSVKQTFSVAVEGDLYSGATTTNSPEVRWESMLYRGVISSTVDPCDASFSFSDDQVKGLGANQLGGTWKNTSGYDFTANASGGYIAFAYPDDGKKPIVQYFDSNFNVWQTYPDNQLRVIDRHGFVNAKGYNKINYKIVLVCLQYKSATVKIRLQ